MLKSKEMIISRINNLEKRQGMMDSKGSKDKIIYLAFIHVNKYGVSAWQAEKSDPDSSLRWG